jgi:hypothetical protein
MPGPTEKEGFRVIDRRGAREEGEPKPPEEAAAPPEGRSIPEVDFATFIISLGSSALIHLGELPPPGEAAPQPNLPLAKQTIDILGMLGEKTRGNLTEDEQNLLEHLLYDLRMKYVDAKRRA